MTARAVEQAFILPANRPEDRARITGNAARFLAMLPADVAWEVTVRRHRKQRTDPQNAALWGVAYPPLMEHIGLRGEKEREELHELFCGEFWGWVRYEILGKVKQRPRRTTTRDEHGRRDVIPWDVFCEFYAYIQQRGAQAGVYIPDPDPAMRQAA